MKCQIYNAKGKLITVEYFQLCQWIGAINLEAQALAVSDTPIELPS